MKIDVARSSPCPFSPPPAGVAVAVAVTSRPLRLGEGGGTGLAQNTIGYPTLGSTHVLSQTTIMRSPIFISLSPQGPIEEV